MSQDGSIRDALQDLATDGLKQRARETIAKLSNGAGQECSIASHKVVCEGTSLALELLLSIMGVLLVRSKASAIWATIGSVGGGVIVVAALKILQHVGIDIPGQIVNN
jgi:hypothetical protein